MNLNNIDKFASFKKSKSSEKTSLIISEYDLKAELIREFEEFCLNEYNIDYEKFVNKMQEKYELKSDKKSQKKINEIISAFLANEISNVDIRSICCFLRKKNTPTLAFEFKSSEEFINKYFSIQNLNNDDFQNSIQIPSNIDNFKSKINETNLTIKLINKSFQNTTLNKSSNNLLKKIIKKTTNNYIDICINRYNHTITDSILVGLLKSEKYYELNLEDYFKFLVIYFRYFVKIKFKLTFFTNSSILIMFYCNIENILDEKANIYKLELQLKNYAEFYLDYEEKLLTEEYDEKEIEEIVDGLDTEEKQKLNKDRSKFDHFNKSNEYKVKLDNDYLDKEVNEYPPFKEFEIKKVDKFKIFHKDDIFYEKKISFLNKFSSNEITKFRAIDKLRLINLELESKMNFNYLKNKSYITKTAVERSFCNLYDKIDNEDSILKNSISFNSDVNRIHLNRVRNIFGEQIAFYFLFIRHCLYWTFYLSLFSLLFYLVDSVYLDILRNVVFKGNEVLISYLDYSTILFSFSLAIWSTLTYNIFKQKCQLYSYLWGIENTNKHESKLLNFNCQVAKKLIFDVYVPEEPVISNTIKRIISFLLSLLLLLFNVSLTFLIGYWRYLQVNVLVTKTVNETVKSFLSRDIYPIAVGGLTSLKVYILSEIFKYAAVKLTFWENHLSQSSFLNSLGLKLFIFEVFNYYLGLLYISFFKGYIEGCLEDNCVYELRAQVYSQLLFSLVIDVLSIILPMIFSKIYKSYIKYRTSHLVHNKDISINTIKSRENTNSTVSSEIKDNIYFTKDPIINIKNQMIKEEFNMIDMVIMHQKSLILFGFCCFFSLSCPLVPLIMCLVLYIDQYIMSFNLFYLKRIVILDPQSGMNIFDYLFSIFYFLGIVANIIVVLYLSPYLRSKPFSFDSAVFIATENLLLILSNFNYYDSLPIWFSKHKGYIKDLYDKRYYNLDDDNLPHIAIKEGLTVDDFLNRKEIQYDLME